LANADEQGGFQGAKRSERSEQSDTVSRATVVRRSEPRRLFLANADEQGGFQGAKRSERSEQSDTARVVERFCQDGQHELVQLQPSRCR
jgi:hypothetical protein